MYIYNIILSELSVICTCLHGNGIKYRNLFIFGARQLCGLGAGLLIEQSQISIPGDGNLFNHKHGPIIRSL